MSAQETVPCRMLMVGNNAVSTVLEEVPSRIVDGGRPYATVGCHGGEEFVTVAPGSMGSS